MPLGFRLCLAAARTASPLGDTNLVEYLGKTQVDLTALHVHFDHLHAHPIAETIDLPGVLAAQNVRALDEAVIVVGHRRNMNHPFDEVLNELDVQAEGGDAC